MNLLAPFRRLFLNEAPAPASAPDYGAVSTERLRASLAAAREAQRLLAELRAEGRNPVTVAMNGQPFEKWRMYPWQGGILDQRSASQYFYHSHPDYRGEHGHFHTFVYHQRRLVHLVALGMTADGTLNRLYTFNRWGPGDHYFPADKLKGFLPRFRVRRGRELDPRLHAYVNAVLAAFRAEIGHLFDERDATFARYRETHGGASPFEDRELEITSNTPADLDAQADRLERLLAGREAAGDSAGETGPDAATAAPGGAAEPLERRPLAELERCRDAGLALRALEERWTAEGRTVLDAVMNGKPREHWAMYPWDGGVTDRRTHSQYFYHAHPQSPEHGHFHTFYHHKGRLVHLVAIALDNQGQPMSLFTVNRWVTDEAVLPARRVKPMLARFRLETDDFDPAVSDYVRHVVSLFRPEIEALLDERDAAYTAYRAAHGGREPYEDRELEIASSLDIDVPAHLARLEAAIARRRADA